MAKEARAKASEPSFLSAMSGSILWLLKAFKPAFHSFREDIERRIDGYAHSIEKHLLGLAALLSLILLCVVLTVLGVLFMLIDYCSLNRGIACLSCGLFIALLLAFCLKMTR